MKKNLLFVIDSLIGAGAEKSLVTLLYLLDYPIYCDFCTSNNTRRIIPKEVDILPPSKVIGM